LRHKDILKNKEKEVLIKNTNKNFMIETNKDLVLTKLNQIITAMKDQKATNITTMNFEKIHNSICDYFVVCEASNNRQVAAITDEIEKQLIDNLRVKPSHIEGLENAQWVLMDYFDIVVHVFQDEYRGFYSIEKLWADAEIRQID